MIKKNQRIFKLFDRFLNVLLFNASYLAAVHLRFEHWNGVYHPIMTSQGVFFLIFVLSLMATLAYDALSLNDSRRRYRRRNLVAVVVAVHGILSLFVIGIMYFFRYDDFSRMTLLIFWFLSTLLFVVKQEAVSYLLRTIRRNSRNLKHVLLAGCGDLALRYVKNVQEHPEYGYWISGYLGDHENASLGKYLGTYDQISRQIAAINPDELVLALETFEAPELQRLINAADKAGIRLYIIPFYNDFLPSQPEIELIGDIRMIDVRATPLDNIIAKISKRLLDIVLGSLLILLTSPIMLICAVGVKLSSPGPILFWQKRIGLHKKPFMMPKFRSMRVNSSEKTGWSTDHDDRKTRFGSLMRKTSCDELVQLFCVVAGTMSLVGPRPEIPYHVEHFKEEIPMYLLRQQVRPGITGWAQIHGFRGDTSITQRVRHDLWYIQNWSFSLDIYILFRTVFGGMINREKLK